MAKYLLFAWRVHRNRGGMNDYVSTFDTLEQAQEFFWNAKEEHPSWPSGYVRPDLYHCGQIVTVNENGELVVIWSQK